VIIRYPSIVILFNISVCLVIFIVMKVLCSRVVQYKLICLMLYIFTFSIFINKNITNLDDYVNTVEYLMML